MLSPPLDSPNAIVFFHCPYTHSNNKMLISYVFGKQNFYDLNQQL